MRTFISAIALLTAVAVPPVARASVYTFNVSLDGASESPANASTGTGTGVVTFNDVAHTMRVQMSFTGLTSTTTASHIHAATAVAGTGTAGVATTPPTFAGLPLGVTSGSYDSTLDLTQTSSYNAAFVTANGGTTASSEAALLAAANAGKAYLDIHTSAFAGGEIRGFLAVPEPASLSILAVTGGLALRRKR